MLPRVVVEFEDTIWVFEGPEETEELINSAFAIRDAGYIKPGIIIKEKSEISEVGSGERNNDRRVDGAAKTNDM